MHRGTWAFPCSRFIVALLSKSLTGKKYFFYSQWNIACVQGLSFKVRSRLMGQMMQRTAGPIREVRNKI